MALQVQSRPLVRPVNMVRAEEVTSIDPLLLKLLSFCTPHGTEGLIVNTIKNLSFIKKHSIDEIEGNLLIKVGDKPTTMFSAHMDIVGNNSPENKKRNLVDMIVPLADPDNSDYIFGSKVYQDKGKVTGYEASTLGADDKVGVWILLKMIQHDVNGLYVFHVGEECGGIGSNYLSTHRKELFTGINRAIAYDRAGYGDIITRQRGGECCSSKFGEALAAKLNKFMPPKQQFKSGITGTFTDTANYTTIIPECTNISAGYFSQHGNNECLDTYWVEKVLLPAALCIDYDNLPTERDPRKKSSYSHYTYPRSYNVGGSNNWYHGNRKTWATADENTPLIDLPIWNVEEGWPDEEACPEAVRKVIINRVVTSYNHEEKSTIAEALFTALWTNQVLMEENAALEIQIALMENKESIGTVVDIEIGKKKTFLQSLIDAYPRVPIMESLTAICSGYIGGAKAFLMESKHKQLKKQYSNREMKKFNRIIFMLAYWFSLSRDEVPDDVKRLLVDIAKYISEHSNEEGFELSTKAKKVVESRVASN